MTANLGAAQGLFGELCVDAHGDPAGIYRSLILIDGDERAGELGAPTEPRSLDSFC